MSHHPNRQQTWVQLLPHDWHRWPFVHQVLLWVEEVRGNSGGAPTWGLPRPIFLRSYSWVGPPSSSSPTSRRTATPNTQRRTQNGQWKCSEVCFAIAKHGTGTGGKVSCLVISISCSFSWDLCVCIGSLDGGMWKLKRMFLVVYDWSARVCQTD